MKKHIRAIFLAGIAAMTAPAAYSQQEDQAPTGTIVSRLLPVDPASMRLSGYEGQESSERYRRLVVSLGDYVIGTENLRIARDATGFQVSADTLTVNPNTPNAPVIGLRDISISLGAGFFWRNASEAFCSWIRSAESLSVGQLTARLPVGMDGSDRVISAGGFDWNSPGSIDGCRLTGSGSLKTLTMRTVQEAGFDLGGLEFTVDLPANLEAARDAQGRTSIAAKFARMALYTDRSDLTHGIDNAVVEIAGTNQSMLPVILMISQYDPFTRDRNAVAMGMDLWNIIALARADMRWNFPQMQTMSATVIPPEMTANFRSVGLSLLSSASQGTARLRGGDVAVAGNLSMVGLGQADITTDLRLQSFDREALSRADAREAGYNPDRGLALGKMSLTWTDRGFNEIFSSLYGLPPDRWIRISRQMMEESASAAGTSWIAGIPSEYHGAVESFFLDSRQGPLGVSMSPETFIGWKALLDGYQNTPETFIRTMRPARIGVDVTE